MKKKLLIGLCMVAICTTLVGCGNVSSESESDDYEYSYNEGFPTSSIVENVPEPNSGDISYYEYDDSVYIYVANIDESVAKEYISSLGDYGWTIDESENNTENSFSSSNENNQLISVDYNSENNSMTIYVYNNY